MLCRGILTNKWKDGFFELFDDSKLLWYENENKNKVEDQAVLVDVEQFICIGHYTTKVEQRPKLPPGGTEKLLICFPKIKLFLKTEPKDICWLLFKDDDQLKYIIKYFSCNRD